MSKFIFTGFLLLLLASFLNYPVKSSESTKKSDSAENKIIFPISEQIKLARMEKHITTKELSSRVGVSKMNMERIEKGQLIPTTDVIEKLEKELGVHFELSNY